GRRRIEVRASGFVRSSQTFDIGPGEKIALSVELTPEARDLGVVATPAEAPDASASFPWWPAALSGGLAFVAVGVGAGLWVGRDGAIDDADRLRQEAVASSG